MKLFDMVTTYQMSRGEKLCKFIFEHLLNEQFVKFKPRWLKNSRGNRMELDMYCKKLNIAVEYNGRQHYKFIPYFQRNEDEFKQRVEDDKEKVRLCKEKGVMLFIVPYTVKEHKMIPYIQALLLPLNIDLCEIHTDEMTTYMKNLNDMEYQELCTLVNKKGGSILSLAFVNYHTKIRLACSKGHEWCSKPTHIKHSLSWCPQCGRDSMKEKQSLGLEQARKDGEDKGYTLLSKVYKNTHTAMQWKCKNSHIFKMRLSNMKNGRTCRICKNVPSSKPHGLEGATSMGIERGFELLSTEYTNNSTPMQWKCKNSHIFTRRLNDLRKNPSCPYCKKEENERRRCLKWLEHAKVEGYKRYYTLLSTEYKNSHSLLKWKCQKDHVFEMCLANLKSNRNCSYCSRISSKLGVEECRNRGEKKGYTLLSTEYKKSTAPLLWLCINGHECQKSVYLLQDNGKCKHCK